jgi:FKBP-type peptidyl-prolyl cis-trans isomerase 2
LAAGSPSFGFLAFLIAVVVIAAGVGAGLLYEYNHPKAPASVRVVQVGDNVTVNYIGLFGSGPEQGKVFDTSLRAVADDNATYPKSLGYSPRSPSQYTPLGVAVGPHVPSAGYNVSGVTYGAVVPGFWQGLLGLAVNQSRWVTVPAGLGYGPLNPSCLVTAPLVQTIPATVTLSPLEFANSYSGVTAASGATFADPTYGWTDTVLSVNASAVVVGLLPYLGETTDPYGWTMTVTAVTSQAITLASDLTPASVGSVKGTQASVTVCSATTFLLWAVDLAAGTFTKNYNHEVVGQTLIFVVTIVSIAGS